MNCRPLAPANRALADRRPLYVVNVVYVLLVLAVLVTVMPFGGKIRCEWLCWRPAAAR